jgi:hypothetical protein
MVYRLAETYLIAAEANFRINGGGLSFLNAIRTRANAAPVGAINQQVILDERARELAFEGQRFFTLKRMGLSILSSQITNYAGDTHYKPDARNNWNDKYFHFPIPTNDLSLLGPNYPQNAGY